MRAGVRSVCACRCEECVCMHGCVRSGCACRCEECVRAGVNV